MFTRWINGRRINHWASCTNAKLPLQQVRTLHSARARNPADPTLNPASAQIQAPLAGAQPSKLYSNAAFFFSSQNDRTLRISLCGGTLQLICAVLVTLCKLHVFGASIYSDKFHSAQSHL